MAEGAVFITGATGLLGTEVVGRLLATTDREIYALVRADSETEAASRLRSLWWDDAVLADEVGNRVHPLWVISRNHLTSLCLSISPTLSTVQPRQVFRSRANICGTSMWRVHDEW